MKEQEIRELVNKEFVGKLYNQYGTVNPSQIIHFIQKQFGIFNSQNFYCNDSGKEARLAYIIWNHNQRIEHPIIAIKVKTQKGQKHYQYGQTWFDWIIKDIEVTLCDNNQNLDIEQVIGNAKKYALEQKEKTDNKYQIAKEAMKALKKICTDNQEDLYKIFDYMKSNYYSLKEAIEKEEK